MTTPRYRRSAVRAVLETVTQEPRASNEAHDALWAALWNRRYDDVDEPVWVPDAVYAGLLVFARRFPEGTTLTAVDTGDAFVVFRGLPEPPPIGSRVRVLPAARDHWKFADGVQPLGLGIDLRFDEHTAPGQDVTWIAALRDGLRHVGDALDAHREDLAARRAHLGALNEPATLEEIWREEVSAISDRVMVETDYTPDEHTQIAAARAKGPRYADETERKIVDARRARFTQRGNEEIARFKEERWPEIRDAAIDEIKKYNEFRTEIVRLEDAIHRIRTINERAMKAFAMLDKVEAADFRVRSSAFDAAKLNDPLYAEEMLRTIELLHSAIPHRAQSSATSFSAYRAPTAGPSVIPPRV